MTGMTRMVILTRLEMVMVILMTDDAPAHDGAVGDSIGIMRLVSLLAHLCALEHGAIGRAPQPDCSNRFCAHPPPTPPTHPPPPHSPPPPPHTPPLAVNRL